MAVQALAENSAPEELEALQARAKLLAERKSARGDWMQLRVEYANLAKKYPSEIAIRNAHGEFLWDIENREGALREWLDAERLDPKNVVILNHLGEAYSASGEVRKSFRIYLRVTQIEPTNALAHFNVANVACLFRHEFENSEAESLSCALHHFAEAHRLAPQNAELARAYAETFYLVPNPDWKTALKVWQEHLGLVSEKNFTFLNLARVHMKLGEADEARECLQQVRGAENQRLKARLGARIDEELAPARKREKSPKPVIDDAGGLP